MAVPDPSTSTRTHRAIAIATATTTLAAGLTWAALAGHFDRTPSPPRSAEPAQDSSPSSAGPRRAPTEDPAIVLVPVERIAPGPEISSYAADEQLAYVEDDEREHHDEREHDDDDEGHDHDD